MLSAFQLKKTDYLIKFTEYITEIENELVYYNMHYVIIKQNYLKKNVLFYHVLFLHENKKKIFFKKMFQFFKKK